MLLHVLLYLSLALSGFALIALLLLRQAVAEQGVAPRPALARASRLAGLLFLLAGGAIALGPGPQSASLMAGRNFPEADLAPQPPSAGPEAGAEPARPGGGATASGAAGAPSGAGAQ
jgi:hypothetical protein